MIDWNDPTCKVSKYFTVKEAIYIPGWKRLADPSDGFGTDQQNALIDYFKKLDLVREFLEVPIIIHCAYRPPVYNSLISGASPDSAHMARNLARPGARPILIAASDWHPRYPDLTVPESVQKAESLLVPRLDEFKLRMERSRGSWIHTDSRPVPKGGMRYFSP
jgi:hypothetical protein